jgi:hypothetical protein
MPITRASKQRSGIYAVKDGFLFVPAEDMWNLHDASKPSAILARAGLGRALWSQWERTHGKDRPRLLKWLYWLDDWPADAGFQPLPSMVAFRQQSRIRAILDAAPRSEVTMRGAWRHDYKHHVTEALLSHWRRLYRRFDWFDAWLLRGVDPPDTVRVVTVQEARRCSRAWDFATFCQRAGIRSDTYVLWLSNRQIPDISWLKWLFAAPEREGVFVVSRELQRLRHETGRTAILAAARLNSARIWLWEQDKRTAAPIKAILAGKSGADTPEWATLSSETRKKMDRVSRAASLDACCARANTSKSTYFAAVREAERYGVKEQLLQYLHCEGEFGTNRSRQCGLVAENFFIPSQDMLNFRIEAEKEGTKQKVWSLANLPGFDAWFQDWATPKSYRGRRHLATQNGEDRARERPPSASTSAVEQPNQEQAPPKRKKKRGRPTGSESETAKQRRKQIVDLWGSGAFPSRQMLAEHLGISRSLVSLALSDAD